MRRAVISLMVLVLGATSACTHSVNGTPVPGVLDVEQPFSSTSPGSSAKPSGDDSAAQDYCDLISWKDLPYEVADKSAPPTDVGYDPDFDQSCKWQHSTGTLDVGVTLRFREDRPITLDKTNGEYTVDGRKVAYFDRTTDSSVQPSCVMVMDYAGGGVGIIVIDGSAKYGAICEQGKAVAEKLLAQEP
ncbi:DUF3558 family protein [Actinosynnema pretiosum]|uniref:DUF3558 domain-containing protein n=1 Tax=Actinosynnema pretiosum TaxID=42197 RepID=A0A290ZDG4_9PSEU|nr:DUF3558 family protein [Actinosynnema pretiosum]ATE57012.1 DUF3558 domain-containing protein [Actinosynnema pretiosum]